MFVDEVADPRHERYLRRTIAEIAAEQRVAPADAMLDLALAERLATRFRFENKTPAWEQAVRESMKHPSILIGVSDGGAHLDRDDGAEWSSYFLRSWVLDRGEWTLEEGIRQLTQVPAALAGFADRGALLAGLRRGPVRVRPRGDRPRREAPRATTCPAASASSRGRTASRRRS